MPQFTHSIDIDASPDEVWSVLGDLAGVDRWIPGITEVSVDGMNRTCYSRTATPSMSRSWTTRPWLAPSATGSRVHRCR
jgi:carbon monoxide dehydrogenase subunit G